jgi:hypothetical protein
MRSLHTERIVTHVLRDSNNHASFVWGGGLQLWQPVQCAVLGVSHPRGGPCHSPDTQAQARLPWLTPVTLTA